jgi:hypothetical protein
MEDREDLSKACVEVIRTLKKIHDDYLGNALCGRIILLDRPTSRSYRVFNIPKEKFDIVSVFPGKGIAIINPEIDYHDEES